MSCVTGAGQKGLTHALWPLQFLMRSGLPVPVLSQAWKLADARHSGKLNRHEFAVAMHLVHCARQNRTLPLVLPEELAVVGTPSSGGDAWAITPAEKMAADKFFAQCDTDRDGYVTGQDVIGLFANSGLPQPVLAQIWGLVDTAHTGRLDPDQFAVAVHLIGKARSGAPVPTMLGPEYRPPAQRSVQQVLDHIPSIHSPFNLTLCVMAGCCARVAQLADGDGRCACHATTRHIYHHGCRGRRRYVGNEITHR